MSWKKLLESTKESLNDHLRLRNEYLAAENRILRSQIDGRVQLTDSERKELAAIGAKLGKKALAEIATVAQPETMLAWNRKFASQPTDASKRLQSVGRPRVDKAVEDLVVRMARENRSWGYDRMQGSLKHLGYTISDQTVGHILKRHGISPAPERQKTVTWHEFIRSHWNVLVATGFFKSELWNGFSQIMACLLQVIDFGRHQVQSIRMPLDQSIRAMAALAQLSLTLILHLQRKRHLIVCRWPKGRARNQFLGPIASKTLFAQTQSLQSRNLTRVVMLLSVRHRRVRDGPRHRQPHHDEQWKDGYRQVV